MKKNKHVTGYIEGFYGRLLSWKDRKLIIDSLNKNKMSTYFYAPKEDRFHRLNWREKYNNNWRKSFRDFTKYSKIKNIDIISGIAPGLDFDFINFYYEKNENKDFNLLYDKAKKLLQDGATSIALLLDDIPDNFKKKFGTKISEGTCHGILANTLSRKLKQDIYFVPRIYADELIKGNPNYLHHLSEILSKKIKMFYCGKNVISKSLANHSRINKIIPNEIIFWDNYYANDYCPRRFFIGPYVGRKNISNVMFNQTGLLKTDLLILDIIANNFNNKVSGKHWQNTLKNHDVPKIFTKIKNFFLKPDFGSNPSVQLLNVKVEDFEALDFLLWKWKGELSREWYPFIFGLKQDLQISKNLLTSDRIIKTQTIPLSKFLKKGE